MENAESLVNKTAEIHEFASEIVRMITGAQMPEFSSENMSVADASKLIGLPAAAIRAGIVYRWLIYWKILKTWELQFRHFFYRL